MDGGGSIGTAFCYHFLLGDGQGRDKDSRSVWIAYGT